MRNTNKFQRRQEGNKRNRKPKEETEGKRQINKPKRTRFNRQDIDNFMEDYTEGRVS